MRVVPISTDRPIHNLTVITHSVTVKKATVTPANRIVTLDGLRGLMTIAVVFSHYFGEVQHGFRIAMVGWIAVDMFFVLSGFLIGKLILERQHHANFFLVFYIRRFCRIIPAYLIMVLVVSAIMHYFPHPWMDNDIKFPLWTYLSFTQIFPMIDTQSIGAHWLAPTWTLAVEEHFYLIAPALIAFTPRKWLIPLLVSIATFALLIRFHIYTTNNGIVAALVLLPARADVLVCGLLAAVAIRSATFPWTRIIPVLRVMPLLTLISVAIAKLGGGDATFGIMAPSLIAVGCMAYLLCIVLGTPEAKRYNSKMLQFFGNNGFCIYLIHLPILGLMHGLILGSIPDIATPAQWLVTVASLPVCVVLSRGMTKLIEEPLAAYGRTWRWSMHVRKGATR